jgi:hypothetical protein
MAASQRNSMRLQLEAAELAAHQMGAVMELHFESLATVGSRLKQQELRLHFAGVSVVASASLPPSIFLLGQQYPTKVCICTLWITHHKHVCGSRSFGCR